MQYDENAEKYGYEGEMMPLKCDELTAYVAPTPDGTGLADYCLKSDVDAAIAELKDVIHELQVDLEGTKATAYADSVDAGMRERRLKRALWLARAERASDKARIFYFNDLETMLDIDGFSYDPKKKKGHKKLTARIWRIIWLKVERKCRAKAEEYK